MILPFQRPCKYCHKRMHQSFHPNQYQAAAYVADQIEECRKKHADCLAAQAREHAATQPLPRKSQH
jgi:selenocysteine lyase/cysteine desulfurase